MKRLIHLDKRRAFIMNIQKRISQYLIILMFGLVWIRCSTTEPLSPQAEEKKTIRHEENIIAQEVWESDKTHIIASEISISHAVLRIKPGTTVQFERGAAISVNDGAGLIVDGTEQPIIFSTTIAEKGAWKYIYFADQAVDDSCQLINCQIEYGGGDSLLRAVIYCANASPAITGCTISNCASSGVTLIGDCRGIKFHDNTISSCDFVPVQTYASNVSSIGNNSYRDNGLNQIRIIEGSVTINDSWQNPSVPYRLADGLRIKTATLTVSPAVELLFEDDEAAIISNGGCLQAVGTLSERIIFTGSDIGCWKGIYFNASANDVNSKLIHCLVENGGQDGNQPANIVLENASPEISNCLIRQSIGYGVYISGRIKQGKLNNNTITNNARAPISISANGVKGLSPGSYLGNGMDVIEVRGGTVAETINEDGYWDNLGIPYRIHGTVQIQSGTLILAPGIHIQMTERSGFEVLIQGGLIADGSGGLITIEGVQQISGIWNQIYFSNTANERNCQLIRCRIGYGGGDINRPGMIYCDNVSPIIRNCMIEYSQTYGIYLNGNAEIPDLQSNFFNGNGYGNYFKKP
jgi:hypothetical protein